VSVSDEMIITYQAPVVRATKGSVIILAMRLLDLASKAGHFTDQYSKSTSGPSSAISL
jgi:hypothetical protein